MSQVDPIQGVLMSEDAGLEGNRRHLLTKIRSETKKRDSGSCEIKVVGGLVNILRETNLA